MRTTTNEKQSSHFGSFWKNLHSRSSGSQPYRKRTHKPLLEILEDRLAPAVDMLDVGGLRFLATDGFEQNANGVYHADDGKVSIGYTPAGTEDFLALVRADISEKDGEVIVNELKNTFNLSKSSMDLVVVGGSPSVPIPILKGGSASNIEFHINQLTGSGARINNTFVEPIEVAHVDFTLNTLQFHNPNGGDTQDAQVKLQGTASFGKVKLLRDLGVTVNVENDNYVIADKEELFLTGLDVHIPLPKEASIKGMKLTGAIDVGYNHEHESFTIGGEVHLSSQTQGKSGKAALDNIVAGLNVTYAKGEVTKLGFDIKGEFAISSLTVSTVQGQPFGFEYNTKLDQFEISGGLQLEFSENEIQADFGDVAEPGIIFKDGKLQHLDASIEGEIHLSKVKLETTGPDGLHFEYDLDEEQFEMGGGVELSIPTGSRTQIISATMNTKDKKPGLIIKDGKLKQLDMQLSGSFDIFGLSVQVMNAGIEYQPADKSLLIGGTFDVDFEVFKTSLTLGTGANPGLSIIDGKFKVDDIKFELENAELGPVTLNELLVSYKADKDSFDLDVDVSLSLPGGIDVAGEFDFVMGKLDTISIEVSSAEGIEIGDTGLFLTEIDAKVTNIETPANIIVSGGIAVVFGETIEMLGEEVRLFRVEGDFTVDAHELILEATAQLGAFSTDDGNTWQGVLGEGDAKLTLDWQDKYYALHVEVDGLAGIFDITGDMVFAAGRDIVLLAEADVVLPKEVPFIGGKKLGGLGFFFEHVFQHGNVPTSTIIAAWIELDIIKRFDIGFELEFDAAAKPKFRLIGSGAVDHFKQEAMPPVDKTYTYSTDYTGKIPESATGLVLSADWSQSAAGVTLVKRPTFRVKRTKDGTTTTITEKEFAAHGIQIISNHHFNGPTKQAIQIVGSTTDPFAPIDAEYTLLVDIEAEGGNPFPHYPNPKPPAGQDFLKIESTYHIPKPTFGARGSSSPYEPVVPTAPTGTFPVHLQGNVDEAFFDQAKVSLYRVPVSDPFQKGILVGTAKLTKVHGNMVNWQATFDVPIDGLYPAEYVLNAIVDDGFNVPVRSADSRHFKPDFAVEGLVHNQNNDPKAGWSVFLDYNQNGKRDANEPLRQTNAGGFYSFTRTFDASMGWDPVPVNEPFDVHLMVLAPAHFTPVDPVLKTFDGMHTLNVPFDLKEKSAIKGSVFEDVLNNATMLDGTGRASAVVYLDQNGNGRRDPDEPKALTNSAGAYDFANQKPGTYTVALDVDSLSNRTPIAAYDVPAGTGGNQGYPYALGMQFDVTQPVEVTSLGVFDSGGDGFHGTLTATLYDFDTATALQTLTFTQADPGDLQGSTRFKALAEPLTLLPGFKGLIVAEGFSEADPNGNLETHKWKTNSGSGALSFIHGYFADNNNSYPTNLDPKGPDPYAAGSLLFREPSWIETSPASHRHTVTINDSGFDVKDGNDFAVLPPAYITGEISGHALVNGQVQQDTEPLADWTVQLLADAPAVAINAGEGAIAGYAVDSHFKGGGVFHEPGNVDISHVVNAPPKEIYKTLRSADSFSYTIPGFNPKQRYTVRLHFAEPAFGKAGERQFDVKINGRQVLIDFDVFKEAGGRDIAIAESFLAVADGNGNITIEFTKGKTSTPLVNAIQIFESNPTKEINSGAGAVAPYVKDMDVQGGGHFGTRQNINTSRIVNPAPEKVYQDGRFEEFKYTIPDLKPHHAYTVRLHFAEPKFDKAGERLFDVKINGRQVLIDFDVFEKAGGVRTAVAESFLALADGNGKITIEFIKGKKDNPLVNGIQIFELSPFTVEINSGASANMIGNYEGDQDAGGGTTYSRSAPIDTRGVFNPAPEKVYQTGRFDPAFNYTITGLNPQTAYRVRLHFAEPFFDVPRGRRFDVAINGQRVLHEFDVFAAAGGRDIAIVEAFDAAADDEGKITIQFTKGSANDPFINGIEILEPDKVVATTTTDVTGRYIFDQHLPGQYTVREAPPADWRQVAPFHSDLKFTQKHLPLLPAGSEGRSVATADFDHDGYLDYVVMSGDSHKALVFGNQKDGTFKLLNNFDVFDKSTAIIAANLNGDHLMDLAVLHDEDASEPVSVFLNRGGFKFEYEKEFWKFPADWPFGEEWLEKGDFNNDGLDDLVYSFNNQHGHPAGVFLLLNSKNPSERKVVRHTLPNVGGDAVPGGVATGDLNGDGNLDLIVNGGPFQPTAFDLDVSYALGDGKGNLGKWTTYPLVNGVSGGVVALNDVQGHGSLDAVFLASSAETETPIYDVEQALNRGNAVFDVSELENDGTRPLTPIPTKLLLEDLNGDLRPDVALLLSSSTGDTGPNALLVYLNTGTNPYFQTANPVRLSLPDGFVAADLAVTDVNNDGFNDVIVISDNDEHRSLLLLNKSPQKQPGIPVFLEAGHTDAGNDFVNAQKPGQSAIHGQLFEDVNRNGRRDSAETGAAGNFVFVDLNRNGQYDEGEPSSVTIDNGVYTISGLADGAYSVGVVPEDGFKVNIPAGAFHEVMVDSQTAAQADFGRVRNLLIPVDDQEIQQGKTLSMAVLTNPAVDHPLVFSLEPGAPSGAQIDAHTGHFTWTPTLADDPGVYDIVIVAQDPFNPLFGERQTVTVTVTPGSSQPPVITNLTTNPASEGSEYRILATFTYLNSPSRTHTATIEWGDGTTSPATVAEANGTGTVTASHVYADAGFYDAKLTIADSADPAVFTALPFTATISGASLQQGVLHIIGTDEGDTVDVTRREDKVHVEADFLPTGSDEYHRADIERIEMTLLGGDDSAHVNQDISIPVSAFGGDGNDSLTGGGGNDTLHGGADNDSIHGGLGNDSLSGDEGEDVVFGNDPKLEEAYELAAEYGFFGSRNFLLNWGGEREKWLKGAGNQWYFILPNGEVYRWNRSTTATGTLVGEVDPLFYQQLHMLFNATETNDAANAKALALDNQFGFFSTGNDYFNLAGKQEKWFNDSTNLWYFILPDGAIHRWNGTPGTAEGIMIDVVDAFFYTNLDRLVFAADYALATKFGIYSTGNSIFNWGGKQEKWFKSNDDQWYFILPDGMVYDWDGSLSATGKLIGSVNVLFYRQPDKFYPILGRSDNDTISGGSGNDQLHTGYGADVAQGDDGGDLLSGGSGDDVLLGADGNDTVLGGSGRDIGIGGGGTDDLRGGLDEDVLISGATAYDADLTALKTIREEWSQRTPYETRVSHLQEGTGLILNGIKLETNTTVFADSVDDEVYGDAGRDYFFAQLGEVKDKKNDEIWEIL